MVGVRVTVTIIPSFARPLFRSHRALQIGYGMLLLPEYEPLVPWVGVIFIVITQFSTKSFTVANSYLVM